MPARIAPAPMIGLGIAGHSVTGDRSGQSSPVNGSPEDTGAALTSPIARPRFQWVALPRGLWGVISHSAVWSQLMGWFAEPKKKLPGGRPLFRDHRCTRLGPGPQSPLVHLE